MIRKIITIDEDKCNGCGLCVNACQEGAIGLKDGKAKLLRDDYCDGLGNCLPACPTDAISFEEREAAAFDEEAVKKHMEQTEQREKAPASGGCPGMRAQTIRPPHHGGCPGKNAHAIHREMKHEHPAVGTNAAPVPSRLAQWPVQLQLVPVNAPYFNGAKLLIAADCSAFTYGNFHEDFMKGKITLIGCPKLDEADYAAKLTEILKKNDIKSVTIVRMSVPCCGGIENAVKEALKNCGKMIPWSVVTIDTDGTILED